MKIVYCKTWNNIFNKPQDVIQKSQAKALHENEEPYSIIFYKDDGKLYQIIEMNFGDYYCDILYFDELERETHCKSFELHDGRLFMRNTFDRFYDQDGREPVVANVTLYESDGTYRMTKYQSGSGRKTQLVGEEKGKVDPTTFYRDMPAFGDYQSLFK